MSNNTIYTTEIINQIAASTNLPKTAVDAVIKSLQDVVATNLQADTPVVITGLVSFKMADRAARSTHHIRTGEAINIPAHRTPVAKVSTTLKSRLKD